MKVGDRVRVKSYENRTVTGEIYDIKKEHTIDWAYYTAYYVEYDEPIPKYIRFQQVMIHRGHHLREDLELCT